MLRSTYPLSLEKAQYPLGSDRCVYSPGMVVFRECGPKFPLWIKKDWVPLDFLALPAVRHPKLVKGAYCRSDANQMRLKIDAIFKIALLHGNDSLVLVALGCGVFKNPPEKVAHLFQEAVTKYQCCFKEIVFAVLDCGTLTFLNKFLCAKTSWISFKAPCAQ